MNASVGASLVSGAECALCGHVLSTAGLCPECARGLPPTMFYAWQKKLFEDGAAVFEQPRAKSSRQLAAEQRKIDALEAKVREKNEVLAELMSEHVALKKSLGTKLA